MNVVSERLHSLKKTDLAWRFGRNLSPTLRYLAGGGAIDDAAQVRVLDGLHRDGVAVTSVGDLFGTPELFDELVAAVEVMRCERADEIASLKGRANDGGQIGQKVFNLQMLGPEVRFHPASIFAKFALQPAIMNIANGYYRMTAKLRYYDVWQTFASTAVNRESQLWHFDREDNYILKMFLYLDDVDEGAGPFTYAPGTHRRGEFRSIKPEFFMEGGVRRTTDEQMNAAYPRDRWRVCTGKKGTIIFADTRGYHKGGEARTRDRLMYTCMYTSPASGSKQLLHIPADIDRSSLTPEQTRALGLG